MTKTLGQELAQFKLTVTPDQYAASRALPARQGGSWALWGSTTSDLSVFDDDAAAAARLRRDVVLIGANFGLGGDAGVFRPFQNFHASSSGGDSKLRGALAGSVLEGAFLTDLVKDYPTKYANGLAGEIRRGELDVETFVAKGFRAEQASLGLDCETLYIPIGGRTRELWDRLVRRGVIPEAQRVFHREYGGGPAFRGKPVRNLAHYSGAVSMVAAVGALLSQHRLS